MFPQRLAACTVCYYIICSHSIWLCVLHVIILYVPTASLLRVLRVIILYVPTASGGVYCMLLYYMFPQRLAACTACYYIICSHSVWLCVLHVIILYVPTASGCVYCVLLYYMFPQRLAVCTACYIICSHSGWLFYCMLLYYMFPQRLAVCTACYYIISTSSQLIWSVPDEGYSSNVSYTLHLIYIYSFIRFS